MDVKAVEEIMKEIEEVGLVPFLQNLKTAASIQKIYWHAVVADLRVVIKKLEGE